MAFFALQTLKNFCRKTTMTIIQILREFFKKKGSLISFSKKNSQSVVSYKNVVFLTSVFFFTIVFFIISNFISDRNIENTNNLKSVTNSKEFSNFTNFLISKIGSPYEEIKYTIKNNDTIEKILKKNNINIEDINNISTKLKQKKLSNIYSGRKLSLILKKQSQGSNTVVNLLFPISNTSSVEVRKFQDDFVVDEPSSTMVIFYFDCINKFRPNRQLRFLNGFGSGLTYHTSLNINHFKSLGLESNLT